MLAAQAIGAQPGGAGPARRSGAKMDAPLLGKRRQARGAAAQASAGEPLPFGGKPFSRTLAQERARRARQQGQPAQAVRQQRSKPAEVVEEEEAEAGSSGGFFASGAAQVGSLVSTLLFGAASRIERGTSVCVTCKGTGAVRCKECNATGVLNVPSSRDTGSSLKSLVGTCSKEKEWIVSNRCRRCKGHGRHVCSFCDGMGKRHMEPPMGW